MWNHIILHAPIYVWHIGACLHGHAHMLPGLLNMAGGPGYTNR